MTRPPGGGRAARTTGYFGRGGVAVLLALLLLIGCGDPNSCADYVDAVATCIEENGLDASPWDAEVICGDWSPEAEATYGEWYQCQIAAYEEADCSEDEAVLLASETAASCPQE